MIDMTAVPDTLLNALEHCDMVEIDGLYALEFYFYEDGGLRIEVIDGHYSKYWEFTPDQVSAATFNDESQSWLIIGFASDTKAVGEHRLVCLGDVLSSADDEDETE